MERSDRKNSGFSKGNKDIATSAINTGRLAADPAGIAAAARLLAEGACVAFGTETVYGLGADARNGAAVADIFAAKGRPRFNPLIAHVADAETALALVALPEVLAGLTAFWPGPLTLVAPMRQGAGISDLVTAGLPTLAVRVPAHAGARALLTTFGGPVAAPSANRSGRISPTTAAHVLADLDGRIAAVLDSGPCAVGVESTIVGVAGGAPVLLRPGGVPAADLAAALGQPLARPDENTITAPGQLASHYAPAAAVRLNARARRAGEFLIGFGPVAGDLNLSPSGDVKEAATNLFAGLRRADAAGSGTIAVAPIPNTGLGAAINDRLRRAAAPRPDTDGTLL